MVDYGDWPSDWSAERAVAAGRDFSELKAAHGGLAWVEFDPASARSRLYLWRDGVLEEPTAPDGSVRSRVYEYGGGACCVTLDGLAWVDETDQQVRRWRAGRAAVLGGGAQSLRRPGLRRCLGCPAGGGRAMGRPGSCIASCAWTPMARAGCWSRAPISTRAACRRPGAAAGLDRMGPSAPALDRDPPGPGGEWAYALPGRSRRRRVDPATTLRSRRPPSLAERPRRLVASLRRGSVGRPLRRCRPRWRALAVGACSYLPLGEEGCCSVASRPAAGNCSCAKRTAASGAWPRTGTGSPDWPRMPGRSTASRRRPGACRRCWRSIATSCVSRCCVAASDRWRRTTCRIRRPSSMGWATAKRPRFLLSAAQCPPPRRSPTTTAAAGVAAWRTDLDAFAGVRCRPAVLDPARFRRGGAELPGQQRLRPRLSAALARPVGRLELRDIEAALAQLDAEGRIDRARVFVRGASAGGYSALRALACLDGLRGGAVSMGSAIRWHWRVASSRVTTSTG